MSEYYQHYLIPVAPEFRPNADALSRFIRELADAGHVSDDSSLSYSIVTKDASPAREMINPFTGETIIMKGPSRKLGKPQSLKGVESLEQLGEPAEEYDVHVSGEGLPPRPPLKMGFVRDSAWVPMQDPCYHEITCRVRSHIVRLSQLRSEDELHRPPDFADLPPPMFDEDCSADETEGLFVHPDAGPVRIANAGCAMFWIEFNYGKLILPLSRDGGVDLLDDSLVKRAKAIFSTDFVQACHWG